MAGAITRRKVTRADLAQWDGRNATVSSVDATGGTVTGLAIGNEVDILQVFGSGTSRTSGTLAAAVAYLGSTSCTIVFAPGTWTISEDVTVPANILAHVPAGCVFSVDSGITLTFNGAVSVERPSAWTTGSGTVTPAGGTDGNPGVFDVRYFGAAGDGSTNDATAINACAVAVRKALYARKTATTTTETPAPVMKFGGGLVYRVNSSIWLGTADTTAASYLGQHVRSVDLDGSTITGYTTGVPIVDWCGGYEGAARMWNGKIVGASTSTPNIGVLLARTSEADEGGGVNAQNSDPRHFVDVQIVGHFTLACLYDYGSELLRYTRGKLWNYYSTGAPALIITNNNVRYAVTSPNVTLSDAAGGSITAAQSCIDFKFWGADIQNKAAALGSYNANAFQASCIEGWGWQEALFDGCFINSLVDDTNLCYSSENASVQPERIVFSNGSFHSDNGTGASIKCAGTHGSLTVTNNRNIYNTLVDHSTGQITRLMVFGNDTKDTINVDTLVGAHLIIQDGLTCGTSFSGFIQTTGSPSMSLPATVAGIWLKHDGTIDCMGGALINVGAMGATDTVGEYLSGTATLSGGSATIALSTTEPDANYRVLITGRANETFYATSVGVSQFTITSSNGSSTATANWMIVR